MNIRNQYGFVPIVQKLQEKCLREYDHVIRADNSLAKIDLNSQIDGKPRQLDNVSTPPGPNLRLEKVAKFPGKSIICSARKQRMLTIIYMRGHFQYCICWMNVMALRLWTTLLGFTLLTSSQNLPCYCCLIEWIFSRLLSSCSISDFTPPLVPVFAMLSCLFS